MFDHFKKTGVRVDDGRPPPLARRAVSVLACSALLILPSAGVGIAEVKDECTPADAWTETIPAQGEPKIEVHNPDYKPEVPKKSHWVHHEAVTEQVTGGWHNFSPNKDEGPLEGAPVFPDDPRGTWQHMDKAIPPGHWNKTGGTAGVYSTSGENGNSSWFYYEGDQTVVIEEAWDEEVTDEPYQPAVGEPTMWVDNPDYVAEQTVEHPAVTCTPEDPVDDPADDQPTKDQPTKDQPTKDQPTKTVKTVKTVKDQPKQPKPAPEPTRPVVDVTG